ncbi:MAG: DUF5658 family protein [Myxococcota bacterium]|nr:DUF5658 family protein [Myxococcota bacterium]
MHHEPSQPPLPFPATRSPHDLRGSQAGAVVQSEPSASGPTVDRRQGVDRRQEPTSPWAPFLGHRNRKRGRRAGENANTYVDRFTSVDIALVVSVLLLNILDALFTMLWIQRGGSEGNPAMAWVLEFGNSAFLVQKCLIVGIWLILLLVHKNFLIARIGLWVLASVYFLLLLYHIALVLFGVPSTDPLLLQNPVRSL